MKKQAGLGTRQKLGWTETGTQLGLKNNNNNNSVWEQTLDHEGRSNLAESVCARLGFKYWRRQVCELGTEP